MSEAACNHCGGPVREEDFGILVHVDPADPDRPDACGDDNYSACLGPQCADPLP